MKTILVDAYNTFIIEGQGINVAMQKLLDTYPNPKIILTNANDEQMVEFGLDKVPYPVFTLKHNPDKVNPVFYKTMLQANQLNAADVVYFEHNPEAVESAKSVGITTYHYDKDAKDLGALKAFLEAHV